MTHKCTADNFEKTFRTNSSTITFQKHLHTNRHFYNDEKQQRLRSDMFISRLELTSKMPIQIHSLQERFEAQLTNLILAFQNSFLSVYNEHFVELINICNPQLKVLNLTTIQRVLIVQCERIISRFETNFTSLNDGFVCLRMHCLHVFEVDTLY